MSYKKINIRSKEMKKLFTNSMIIFALLLLVVSTESKADGTEKAKINELSDQIVIEIKEV